MYILTTPHLLYPCTCLNLHKLCSGVLNDSTTLLFCAANAALIDSIPFTGNSDPAWFSNQRQLELVVNRRRRQRRSAWKHFIEYTQPLQCFDPQVVFEMNTCKFTTIEWFMEFILPQVLKYPPRKQPLAHPLGKCCWVEIYCGSIAKLRSQPEEENCNEKIYS